MVLRMEAEQPLGVTPYDGDDEPTKPDIRTSLKDQNNKPKAEGRSDLRNNPKTAMKQEEGILHILTED